MKKVQLIVKGDKLPPLYSQENVEDPLCRTKLFSIRGDAAWYLYEYSDVAPDKTPRLGFGVCYLGGGNTPEVGYVSLDELDDLTFAGGVPVVERDRYWSPMTVSAIMEAIAKGSRP
jgi:hypothetical protein